MKVLLGAGLLLLFVAVGALIYSYVRFSRVIDARLSGDVFNNASLVFSAPTPVFVGEAITPEEVAARLRKGLYAAYEGGSKVGTYRLVGNRLEIRPGSGVLLSERRFQTGRRGAGVFERAHRLHHLAFRRLPAGELQS